MSSGPAPISQLRTLAYSFVAAPAVIVVAMWFVLAADGIGEPPLWSLGVVLAVALAGQQLIQARGYRAAAIPVGTPTAEAAQRAVLVFQTGLILRFALSEVAMVVAIAVAFLVEEGGFLVVVLGCALALVSMFWHVVPSDTHVNRITEALASEGARVPLREALYGELA